MIDKMSGRVALLVVTVAILAVFLLGWFLLLSPQRSKVSKLDTQIEDTDTQLAAVTRLLHSPVAKQSIAALKIAKVAVPDDPNVAQLLRQLSAASAQAGVELDTITPQAPVAAAAGEEIPLGVTVTGRYFAIQRFFRILRTRAVLNGDKLRASGRLYTVDGISFSGATTSPSSGTGQAAPANLVSATITVNAFAFSTPVVAGATPTDTTSANTTVTPPVVTGP